LGGKGSRKNLTENCLENKTLQKPKITTSHTIEILNLFFCSLYLSHLRIFYLGHKTEMNKGGDGLLQTLQILQKGFTLHGQVKEYTSEGKTVHKIRSLRLRT
jgi:hypothetical protein